MLNKLKGQTTMVFILFVIIIFAGTSIFLLSLAETVSQSEYTNLYVHRLLSSVLKTDTGYTDPACKTVSDLLACSFLSPTHICGSGQDCFTLAEQEVESHMSRFADIRQGFRYLILVESESFVSLPEGLPHSVEIGDSSLREEKSEKITANQRIQKVLGETPYMMNARLMVSRRTLESALESEPGGNGPSA